MVLRNEQVEQAQPGDRVVIVGTLIVIPEVYSMIKPGEKFELAKGQGGIRTQNMMNMEGLTGLKSMGVKDLNYKMVFLANFVQVNDTKMGIDNVDYNSRNDDIETTLDKMSEMEKREINRISKTPDLFNKLS